MDPSFGLEDLSCPNCFKYFSERRNIPHVLECGHSYCHRCLNKLRLDDLIVCPTCEQPINFDSIISLPRNTEVLNFLKSLHESLPKTEELQTEKVKQVLLARLDEINSSIAKHNQDIYSLDKKIKEIDDKKRKLVELKVNLKRAKLNISSTSMRKSIESMKKSLSTVDDTLEQNKIISDDLDKGQQNEFLQSVFDSPQDYFISSENTSERTTFFTDGKLMYIKSFPQQLSSTQTREVKMKELEPFIQKGYIKFESEGFSFFAEFELFNKNCTKTKQFLNKCLGEEKSFRNAKIYNHDRIGLNGESICIGIEGDNNSCNYANDLCFEMSYIKKGYITAVEDESINHYKIYLEDWPSATCSSCLGKVTTNLNRLKSVLKNKINLKLNCGVIANFNDIIAVK